jgi:hypothetical protein
MENNMAKKALVIGQTREYNEGWQAYSDGISHEGNPYEPGTAAEFAWRHGWEAKEAMTTDDEDARELRDDPTEH